MAGNYPDVPAPRLAFDRNGTTGFIITYQSTLRTMSASELQNANNESSDTLGSLTTLLGSNSVSGSIGLVFPCLYDISGFILFFGGTPQGLKLETSVNTTNGQDGTWVIQINGVSYQHPNNTRTAYRTSIQSSAYSGIRGIRARMDSFVGSDNSFGGFHFYGAPAAGELPDRLRLWHPTLDEPLDDNTTADGAYFDWGNIQRNTSADRTFRIKNNSATLTANSIIISQQTLTDTTPAVNSQFTFSNGGAFATSLDIGNLAPGGISPVITKRYTLPSNAALSLWASRTIANPTSWS